MSSEIPVVEGNPYPVFVEQSKQSSKWNKVALHIGKHGPGDSQITVLSLPQARLLAYALLREVENKLVDIEQSEETTQISSE